MTIEEAAHTHNESGKCPALIVCEHASNYIPPEFKNLGLSDNALSSHIAWDPGAAEVSRELARLLDATCVLGSISRLVYDCNRPPEAQDAMPEKSEVYRIPGNEKISPKDKQKRVNAYYLPFEKCVAKAVSGRQALITIHSFTPIYNGKPREVQLGILHDDDTILADRIISEAEHHTELLVRRNDPYGPQHGVMHTLNVHGINNAIPNVMIEIRNDLIQTTDECKRMAVMLSGLISTALNIILASDANLEKRP